MGGEESETKEDKKWWQSRKKYILIGLIILIVFYVGYKFYPVKGTDVIRKMSMTKKKTCGSASQSNQIYWKEWLNDVNKVEIGDIFRPCPSGGKKNACDREVMGKIALVVNPKTNGLNVTYRAKAELEEDIKKGSINLKVSIDGMSAVNKDFEMCKMSNLTHINCPVHRGLLKLHDSFALPKFLMKGIYHADARLADQNENDIACVTVQFEI